MLKLYNYKLVTRNSSDAFSSHLHLRKTSFLLGAFFTLGSPLFSRRRGLVRWHDPALISSSIPPLSFSARRQHTFFHAKLASELKHRPSGRWEHFSTFENGLSYFRLTALLLGKRLHRTRTTNLFFRNSVLTRRNLRLLLRARYLSSLSQNTESHYDSFSDNLLEAGFVRTSAKLRRLMFFEFLSQFQIRYESLRSSTIPPRVTYSPGDFIKLDRPFSVWDPLRTAFHYTVSSPFRELQFLYPYTFFWIDFGFKFGLPTYDTLHFFRKHFLQYTPIIEKVVVTPTAEDDLQVKRWRRSSTITTRRIGPLFFASNPFFTPVKLLPVDCTPRISSLFQHTLDILHAKTLHPSMRAHLLYYTVYLERWALAQWLLPGIASFDRELLARSRVIMLLCDSLSTCDAFRSWNRSSFGDSKALLDADDDYINSSVVRRRPQQAPVEAQELDEFEDTEVSEEVLAFAPSHASSNLVVFGNITRIFKLFLFNFLPLLIVLFRTTASAPRFKDWKVMKKRFKFYRADPISHLPAASFRSSICGSDAYKRLLGSMAYRWLFYYKWFLYNNRFRPLSLTVLLLAICFGIADKLRLRFSSLISWGAFPPALFASIIIHRCARVTNFFLTRLSRCFSTFLSLQLIFFLILSSSRNSFTSLNFSFLHAVFWFLAIILTPCLCLYLNLRCTILYAAQAYLLRAYSLFIATNICVLNRACCLFLNIWGWASHHLRSLNLREFLYFATPVQHLFLRAKFFFGSVFCFLHLVLGWSYSFGRRPLFLLFVAPLLVLVFLIFFKLTYILLLIPALFFLTSIHLDALAGMRSDKFPYVRFLDKQLLQDREVLLSWLAAALDRAGRLFIVQTFRHVLFFILALVSTTNFIFSNLGSFNLLRILVAYYSCARYFRVLRPRAHCTAKSPTLLYIFWAKTARGLLSKFNFSAILSTPLLALVWFFRESAFSSVARFGWWRTTTTTLVDSYAAHSSKSPYIRWASSGFLTTVKLNILARDIYSVGLFKNHFVSRDSNFVSYFFYSLISLLDLLLSRLLITPVSYLKISELARLPQNPVSKLTSFIYGEVFSGLPITARLNSDLVYRAVFSLSPLEFESSPLYRHVLRFFSTRPLFLFTALSIFLIFTCVLRLFLRTLCFLLKLLI